MSSVETFGRTACAPAAVRRAIRAGSPYGGIIGELRRYLVGRFRGYDENTYSHGHDLLQYLCPE